MGSMRERLDADYAEAWKPAPGDELIGKIIDLGRRTTEWGTYMIVTVKPEDGPPKAFHAYHTVAADALAQAYPSVGDEIGIRYLGKVVSEKSQYGGYQGYKIVVEHPAGWSPPPVVEDTSGQADREAQEAREAVAGARATADDDIPF
jgi:hypothetical protein